MKNMKKVFALVLVAVMVLALSATAFAQTVGGEQTAGKGQIVISNAANGERYKVIKLFDATVKADGTSIAYTGNIPAGLGDYFEKDAAGNITAKDAAWKNILDENNQVVGKEMSDGLKSKLNELYGGDFTDGTVSDGSTLYFNNLDYGYYVVCTTQGDNLVTVDSTNPVARVIDKNLTPPVHELKKLVDGAEDIVVNIGDELTFTVAFKTSNYDGADQITKYVITDTLPAFLDTPVVTSITIDDGVDHDATEEGVQPAVVTQQFDANGKITIPWTEGTTSLYGNGATVTIVYKAKVNANIQAGQAGVNKNEVTIDPYAGDKKIEIDQNSDSASVKTYAAAVQKVDENNQPLAGATFQVPGLTVTGTKGNYTVVSYNPTPAEAGGEVPAGTTMECDDNGLIVIRGLASANNITIYEVDAPDGYNKLTSGETLPVVATQEVTTTTSTTTTTTTYYDADGNIVDQAVEGGSSVTTSTTTLTTNEDLIAGALKVVNQKGAELPSTGGIGTTIFFVVGGLMMAAAVVLLITKKRAGAAK